MCDLIAIDINQCQLCGEKNVKDGHFWGVHKMTVAKYYQTVFPRYSKLSHELLPFKNKEQYLNNNFYDKREMVAWFKAYPDQAKTYAIELLKKRKEKKGLIYTPSQVELRSIMSPSIIWFKENFDSYNQLCGSLGFVERFDLENEIPIFKEIEGTILIDSREQRPLRFNYDNCKRIGLPYGDYSLKPN